MSGGEKICTVQVTAGEGCELTASGRFPLKATREDAAHLEALGWTYLGETQDGGIALILNSRSGDRSSR